MDLGNQLNYFILLKQVQRIQVGSLKKNLKKQIENKSKEEEIPIPDIDELIDEKKKFNDGWW